MAKFATRVRMRCVISALSSWVDFAKWRKRVRRLVNRLLVGREGLALREVR